MNKRIQELIDRATTRIDPIAYDGACWNFDKEKFAELIVRECANIDFRREVGLTADDDYEIGKVIKVHFGVEE
jgi:hypothetical protein